MKVCPSVVRSTELLEITFAAARLIRMSLAGHRAVAPVDIMRRGLTKIGHDTDSILFAELPQEASKVSLGHFAGRRH